MSQTCQRCYKVVDRACQSETESSECRNLLNRVALPKTSPERKVELARQRAGQRKA